MPSGIYPREIKPARQRIMEGIHISASGCWEWQRRVLKNGYGVIAIGQHSKGERKNAYAHRLAYEVFVGPIPERLDLDHLCRNRKCCNPEHLEPVTRRENILRGIGPQVLGMLNSSKT
ncbi:MAG TPA: HNH endonuclease signature motif containing protein, partial [Candidatus Limnocylindrales bacterium]|nr:HNH endonuclease signature motif containing protein [Candidatus Limnocylindrales bacterium]